MEQNISKVMPAKWSKVVRYLGIKICKSPKQMVEENIYPIITYIQDQCKMWEVYKMSWLGHAAAVKMILLPKLLFVFLNTNLDVPKMTLSKIKSIINKYIWGARKLRIKFSIAEKKIQDGGIAIPNINRYYEAALLVACVEWWRMLDNDVLLLLEQKGCVMKLSTWLVANSATRRDIDQANWIVQTLGKVWLMYKKNLAPHFVDPFEHKGKQRFVD